MADAAECFARVCSRGDAVRERRSRRATGEAASGCGNSPPIDAPQAHPLGMSLAQSFVRRTGVCSTGNRKTVDRIGTIDHDDLLPRRFPATGISPLRSSPSRDEDGSRAACHQRRTLRRGGTCAGPAGRQLARARVRGEPGLSEAGPIHRDARDEVRPFVRGRHAKPLRPAAGMETGAAGSRPAVSTDSHALGSGGAGGRTGRGDERRPAGPPHP